MNHEFTAEERFAIIWAQHQQDMAAGAFKKYGRKDTKAANKKPKKRIFIVK